MWHHTLTCGLRGLSPQQGGLAEYCPAAALSDALVLSSLPLLLCCILRRQHSGQNVTKTYISSVSTGNQTRPHLQRSITLMHTQSSKTAHTLHTHLQTGLPHSATITIDRSLCSLHNWQTCHCVVATVAAVPPAEGLAENRGQWIVLEQQGSRWSSIYRRPHPTFVCVSVCACVNVCVPICEPCAQALKAS